MLPFFRQRDHIAECLDLLFSSAYDAYISFHRILDQTARMPGKRCLKVLAGVDIGLITRLYAFLDICREALVDRAGLLHIV